jgi:hypothetical protein
MPAKETPMPDAMLAYLLKSGESTVMADGDVLSVQLPSSIEIGRMLSTN